MKLKFVVFLALAMFASIGGIPLAQAQPDETDRANVPFDFHAKGQKMQAGDYIITVDVLAKMIKLSDASGEHTIYLMGIPADGGSDKPELVFNHSGDTYALKEVKSNVIDLTFHTRVPEQAMESRVATPQVEVALNRQ